MKVRFLTIFLLITVFSMVFAGGSKESADDYVPEPRDYIVIYAYDSFVADWGAGPEIVRLFEAKTGLRVDMISVGDAAEVLSRAILEKDAGLAELFEMGEYNKYAGKFHYAVAMKDAKQTLELMDKLMTHYDSLMDFVKSPLYEHMTFANSNPAVLEGMKTAQLNRYLEDDSIQFVRESPGWEDFKKKWYKK